MHIMLVNDDGIHAKGIRTLCKAAADAGHRVSICAPDTERSAASHAISLRRPLHAVKIDVPGAETAYAVDGLPADCARLGLYLIPDVDLVISGINNGQNLGAACIYSGTVGAATEASMSGVPALAASLCGSKERDFTAAARVTLKTAEWMLAHPLPRGAIYNLNVPNLPYGEILGVRAASMAQTYHDSPLYKEVEAEDGVGYAYTHGVDSIALTDENCDELLCRAGWATLTKLWWNLRMEGDDPDVSDLSLKKEKSYEIERKYLIAMPDEAMLAACPGCKEWEIEQIYLTAMPGQTRRVRRVVEDGRTRRFKTFKLRITPVRCVEEEGEIDEAEYNAYLQQADPDKRPILKTRYRIPHEGQLLEFDVYPFWKDRAVLEIELESESEAARIPDWVKVYREVTDDYRYKNVRLASEVPMDEI